jgi:hypothetical protein
MRRLFSILAVLFLFVGINDIYSQAEIDIPITISNNAPTPSSTNTWIGLDLSATDGLDFALGEANLPPLPPAGVWDVRYDLGGSLSSFRDYRNATSYPYTGSKTHSLKWQQQTGATTVTIAYDMPANSTLSIQDLFGGVLINVGPFSGAGSYTVTNAAITNVNLIVDYTVISPVVAGPVFNISPASPLTITPTAVGNSNTANVTVNNSGTAVLDITSITSSDAQFTIAPLTASIPVGGNQVFVVTFTPASLGSHSSNLSYTHNAAGSPSAYVVNGVGASAGPTFAVNPTSLSFGSVIPGNSVNQTVTVNNDGLTNALSITSVTVPTGYSVSPISATIPALGSQVFTITFAPALGGTYNGDLTFTHNAPGSPSVVALTGSAVSLSGLVFDKEYVSRLEDSVYTDVLQLQNLNVGSGTLQALSFKLLVNYGVSDDTLLTFLNLQKGSDVSDPSWLLQTEVKRGFQNGDGAKDTVIVLLYNSLQNNGLVSGSYTDLLRFRYRTANLPALQDSSSSSFSIIVPTGSNANGGSINISSLPVSLSNLSVSVKNRVGSFGDVNGDGFIDILDLIDVVDHILERRLLTGPSFVRANIAPWGIGNPAPTPDGVVNVQDLTVIQNIILTGIYPSGVILNKPIFIVENEGNSLNKTTSEAEVELYITSEGISVRLNSTVGIRGAQIELGSVVDNTSNMIIDSKLGGGFYNQINELLRVLLYDQGGNAFVQPGLNYVANMPFEISNPENISVEKIVLVDIMNNKVGTINVEIFYNNAPEIPVDYSLSQNFPNPFNPSTSVNFSVPTSGLVTLKVYDMIGQEVATLFSGNAERGTYTLVWNGKDNSGNFVSSGSYIYRMTSGDFTQSKKMLFLK